MKIKVESTYNRNNEEVYFYAFMKNFAQARKSAFLDNSQIK